MRYVILKKINNIWYATRNRYTAKELEVLVNKLYDGIVDFELINDGECQGLDDGVIIVKDDDRELNENGTYLNDDLTLETKTEKKSSNLWVYVVTFVLLLFFGVKITLGFGALYVILKFVASFDNNNNKDVQSELPENHKAQGMM
nr:MAG TPA: hypothetical protein [Caudoviricetes sp.]